MAIEQGDDTVEILLVEPNAGDTRLFTEKFRDAKIMNRIRAVTTVSPPSISFTSVASTRRNPGRTSSCSIPSYPGSPAATCWPN